MINLCQKTKFHQESYEAIYQKAQSCQACPLAEQRQHVVFGHGPANAGIMLIGEGPGQQEDEQGKPFVGRSGKLLSKIFESVGIDRERDVYIANTVKCRPPQNRTPKPAEIDACQGYLIRQIQCIQPRILLLCGAPAMRSILQTSEAISRLRGKWIETKVPYMTTPLKIMTIFHPSYLLRNASKETGKPKWLTWQDMKNVKKYWEETL
ncbi:MAG: uracil-DNA glycosylase [bacterium]